MAINKLSVTTVKNNPDVPVPAVSASGLPTPPAMSDVMNLVVAKVNEIVDATNQNSSDIISIQARLPKL